VDRARATDAAGGAERLAPLVVIDRLELTRLRVEPRRLKVDYAVTSGGTTEVQQLIYRWEEPVFDDSDGSRNLAAMIAVQVALNYGLFCREIVFDLPLDEHDRVFVEEFVENTSREILVHKFLAPNPFLQGLAARIEPVVLGRYTAARLVFTGQGGRGAPWTVSPERHAILSSGGKDSLLTLGLLTEIGRETHPIFINESGRHWYTALNAYRHLKQTHPGTARAWTDSDRLFAWMLRKLPFVRRDFARVRSDEYPIRLWTVAVFLFGALPLVRKRGIGRLLIGNEFDTTVPALHHGIRHYSALYDQSRFFDHALSRYFHVKGWNVDQFSVLRPLSELLIQRTLALRYPELQRHQLSCHAAHLDGDRVRPCGDCEKCRRIVGMLCALGADPAHCGYTPDQVRRALVSLSVERIHQEQPAAQHLSWNLVERGLIERPAHPAFRPALHPEVLSLRFDRLHARADDIPRDLRRDLWPLLLAEAEGAVRRAGRKWEPFDPLAPEFAGRPYPFEPGAPAVEAVTSARAERSMRD
jgi:hypothetical protein